MSYFGVEEAIVLPAVPAEADAQAMAVQVRAGHEHFRSALALLSGGARSADVEFLRTLGGRLSAHVRLEERELFPYLERALDEATLAALARRIASAIDAR